LPFPCVVVMIEKVKSEIELMQRHIEVLRTVVEHEPIGIMKLSELRDLAIPPDPVFAPGSRADGLYQGITCRSDLHAIGRRTA